jgi:hypothetical protein
MIGEEARDDLDPDTLEPVRVQQGARGLGSRHPGMIRDRAVAPEGRPDQCLDREAEKERHDQEKPDCGAHGRTLSAGPPAEIGPQR